MKKTNSDRLVLPVLPLRDVVVYPNMTISLFVGREKSIKALENVMEEGKEQQIFLVAQKDASEEDPSLSDVYSLGTVSKIVQMLTMPDGAVKVLAEGLSRAKLSKTSAIKNDFLESEIQLVSSTVNKKTELDALMKVVRSNFLDYAKTNKRISQDMINSLEVIEEPSHFADMLATIMNLTFVNRQKVLELTNVTKRFEFLLSMIEAEVDFIEVEKRIKNRIKQQMERNQKEYYLNEQIKAIQKELGDADEKGNESEQLLVQIAEKNMPAEVREKLLSEVKKLRMMQPLSAEATVVRNYIETMLQVPWSKKTKIKTDLRAAEKMLDKEHYGLERVKERILEYLATQIRTEQLRGPILCLIGPPGVGKTSLGQSIAHATGRKYVRVALGGVRDEAEIRGHRRTYIGAMPGKIMQKMMKVGVNNPLFLLDEIDKMSSDMRGDPASALLEVLDPEQNHAFNDHYLEADYDLSNVMFLATSNSMNIPLPLIDRMEVIRLSGYTDDEKLNIAKNYLLPKQIKNAGLKKNEIIITEQALLDIIHYYTREAGIRNLEREIATLCRKTVKILLSSENKKVKIDEKNLSTFLGVRRFHYGAAENDNCVGQVTGLAWTEVGGDLLSIEVINVIGKGKQVFTGSLGDVMKESIQTAVTVVRSHAKQLGINEDFHEKRDIHIHVPEGATPKDGPSAGIAMCTAIVSSLTGNPVKANLAMTGEVTLRGKVLAIGGLKEKLLAAHRGGIKTVIIPLENAPQLEEIPQTILQGLEIYPVSWVEEVLSLALENNPFGAEFVKIDKKTINKSHSANYRG